jgi:hypothetical protein
MTLLTESTVESAALAWRSELLWRVRCATADSATCGDVLELEQGLRAA